MSARRVSALEAWYRNHGRHDLAWRATRDRWPVLVSEVMLHQTQVPRVAVAWPAFIDRFPTERAMADAGPGAVIDAWGRLGYPRRARRLWETSAVIASAGWPDDLATLPGVGRYTANAVLAQADDLDIAAVEVNVRRVVERCVGRRLSARAAEDVMLDVGAPLRGRDRLLALMDVGALCCRVREPRCGECPLHGRCAARGPLAEETRAAPQGRFAGSFRQRRGAVLATLRTAPAPVAAVDREALDSLVADGLARVDGTLARLP